MRREKYEDVQKIVSTFEKAIALLDDEEKMVVYSEIRKSQKKQTQELPMSSSTYFRKRKQAFEHLSEIIKMMEL